MKYNVAQIIPYFGKWPEWIELYFYSCGRNPMIDFIFYTDCPLPKHQYKNTLFNQCTFEQYVTFVSKRLNLTGKICRPYKLTDLKPFLGAVHEEELKSYDFWSFGDIDLVYGDLSVLLNDSMLGKYDIITTHSNRIAGHFTIIKNNSYYRNLCFKIKGWKEGLVCEEHMCYDENAWTCLINPFQHNIDRLYRFVFTHCGVSRNKLYNVLNKLLLKRKYVRELNTTPFPQPEFNGGKILQWQYDIITNHISSPVGMGLPYLHFMAFKKCQYVNTENHWKQGYWKLDNDIEKYRYITFDYLNVEGKI